MLCSNKLTISDDYDDLLSENRPQSLPFPSAEAYSIKALVLNLFDLAIIYLACGAPFAVQYWFRLKDRGGLEKTAKCVFVGLAWPVFAVIYAVGALKHLGRPVPPQTEAKRLIEEIRRSLEDSVDLSGRPDAAFEFRRAVLRWAELSIAVRKPTTSPAATGVWEIVEHSQAEIASAAYIHREKRLLDAHFAAAREDIIGLAESLKDNADFRARAVEAAMLLKDDLTVQALTRPDSSGSSVVTSA